MPKHINKRTRGSFYFWNYPFAEYSSVPADPVIYGYKKRPVTADMVHAKEKTIFLHSGYKIIQSGFIQKI